VEGEAQSSQTAKRTLPTWGLIVFAVLALYALLILVLNRGEVEIHFVVFSTRISKIVLILLCLGIGFAAGFLFDNMRDRRRRSASS
jgi:uncharacterized integral membrane protein